MLLVLLMDIKNVAGILGCSSVMKASCSPIFFFFGFLLS
jgi:hypothetical protein